MAIPQAAQIAIAAVPYAIEGNRLFWKGLKSVWNKLTGEKTISNMSDEALKKLLGDAYYPEAKLDLKEGRLKLVPGMDPALAQQQAQFLSGFRQQNAQYAGREIPGEVFKQLEKITFISPEEQRQQQFRQQMLEGLGPRMETSLAKLENLQASPLEQQSQQAYMQMLPQLQQEAFGPTPTASLPSAIARQNQQGISPQTLQALQFLAPYAGKAAKGSYDWARENVPKAYSAGKTRISQGLSKLGF